MSNMPSHRERSTTLNVDSDTLFTTIVRVYLTRRETCQIFTRLIYWLLKRGTLPSYRKAKIVLRSLSTTETKVVNNTTKSFFLASFCFQTFNV